MALQITRESFGGFDNCVAFHHNGLKLVVTTEVGPRILHFSLNDGPNMLLARPEHAGQKLGAYRSYGGHRLWVAPEERPKTYTSDSFPVAIDEQDDKITFSSIVDEYHIRRSITIATDDSGFVISHQIHNEGAFAIQGAAWAITVMEPGGVCRVPRHSIRPQSDGLLPVSNLITWGYTSLSDPRYTLGEDYIELRSTDDPNPTKFGCYVTQGEATYTNLGYTFTKKWQPQQGPHADMGCNFESYTKAGMLEVETLGPMVTIPSQGASPLHVERWSVARASCP